MLFKKVTAIGAILAISTLAFAQSGFSDKDYKAHLEALKNRDVNISDINKTVMVSKPFVIITDINLSATQKETKEVVELSIKTFKKLFFKNNPKNITDIWIFKDRAGYVAFNHAFLNSTARDDVAGYYMRDKDALVLAITTGIGTIIHEMLHSFMDNNFVNAPVWFEEGLASLYEGTLVDDKGLRGDLNWRLPWLKENIRANALGSFKTLSDMNVSAFYEDKSVAINYAQSRYMFYYLQEKGLLVEYYSMARKNIKDDPTGYKSLLKVLKIKDMKAFSKEWEKYILELEDWMHYVKRMNS